MGKAKRQNEDPVGPVPSGASIRVMRGFFEGLEVPVDRDWVVIGRGRGADVVISEPTMSRAHAAIGYDGEQFFVQDLGSTNGTRVNGSREQKATLKSGDDIQLGKLLVRVELPR
ncbi:MAG: FHA domain-containing protein [Myxococcales bacterium]|nr:FHA domain-containing protein [Myxococcales bacterium]MDH5307895.1 FHA domain-containing protein [Myxococcales bacterium]MDH5566336.1 FHA domain-containing protein [Myxococcales bacterium]